MLEATGERLVPDQQKTELVYAEHFARYRLAATFARGKRVLDAGSGEGYGADVLARAGANSVVGIDVAEEVVRHAHQKYGLEFLAASISSLPFEDGSFDLVVCFEVIEHVADAERALRELRRVLGPDGLLVISTPNSAEYLVENEFHEREYTLEAFTELLSADFPDRLQMYQQNWLLSAILDERGFEFADPTQPIDVEVTKAVGLGPQRALYSVVVCGPVETIKHVAVATGVFEAQAAEQDRAAWANRANIAERQRAEWEKRATIAERQRAEWEKRATIAERQRAEWEKRATIAERQREAWEKRAAEAERLVHETRDQLGHVEAAFEELVTSRSWRITRPLRALGPLGGRRR
jgi:SAM-dependent methyltransferase